MRGYCAVVARAVLPIAVQRDHLAHTREVYDPSGSRRKRTSRGDWVYHHVLVAVEMHFLDAYTKTQGCPYKLYLNQHWQYGEYLATKAVSELLYDAGIEDDDEA